MGRLGSGREALFDAKEAAFLAGTAGVDGFEESLGLDEPRFEIFVDVEHEDQIFVFEVAGEGRVVAAAAREEWRALEVDDVAARGIVDVPELFAKLAEREVAQQRHFAAGGMASDLR